MRKGGIFACVQFPEGNWEGDKSSSTESSVWGGARGAAKKKLKENLRVHHIREEVVTQLRRGFQKDQRG